MVTVTMKELLEAGVHFGHQTTRWNPKMKDYIFGQRNGIYIIDLQKTIKIFKDALLFIKSVTERGKGVLLVGTKKQAQDIIKENSLKCESNYVNQRWLGGLLTNFEVIRGSVERLIELDEMKEDGRWDLLSKKEKSKKSSPKKEPKRRKTNVGKKKKTKSKGMRLPGGLGPKGILAGIGAMLIVPRIVPVVTPGQVKLAAGLGLRALKIGGGGPLASVGIMELVAEYAGPIIGGFTGGTTASGNSRMYDY